MFDLLVYLVENRDRVVTKDDLIETVWDGRIVSELTLTSRINAARSGRRQRQGSGRDPHHRAKGLSLRRQTSDAATPRSPQSAQGTPAGCCSSKSHRPTALFGEPAPLARRPAIAVLPFVNLSGETEQEYFSDGISEDIITALSKLRWFSCHRAQFVLHVQEQGGRT